MFWNEERLKWYFIASIYTKYHKNMANVLKSIIPKGESLMDLGSGPALLSLELKDYFKEILAIDFDESVISILNKKIEKENIKNFKAYSSDCYDEKLFLNFSKKDNILFSHFGKIEEYFSYFKNFFNKRMIIIRNDIEKNIVYNKDKDTIQDITNYLEKLNINYKIYRQNFEFGQPLLDEEEAIYYLKKWYKENYIKLLSNVKDIDYFYNGIRYTKYYCKPKSTAIVIIKKEDLDEKI